MITNKSIDTIECETYLSHKLNAIIKTRLVHKYRIFASRINQ